MELTEKYPPSEPCSCETCLAYCVRPGWWAVNEAFKAFEAGFGSRMMLEASPDRSFGVLSPAFKGCEGMIATNRYASNGCTFLTENLCGLFGSVFQPLECRFCHHTRKGQGVKCHTDLEADWMQLGGRLLVRQWCRLTGIWDLLDTYGLQKLRK
jgi:hypothetical protein